MNILLINHYAGSPYHGMEYRPYYLARIWTALGHRVRIVGGSYSHVRTVQPPRKELGRITSIDGVEYYWIKTPLYKGNSIGRFISMISFVSRLYIDRNKFLQNFSPDVVIASSTYPLDIFPAHFIAQHCGASLFFEVHDLWPLSPMQLANFSKYHPFIILMQIAENYAYQKSDAVVSILPKTLEHMVHHGLVKKKFHHIPNGINIEEWECPQELPVEHARVLTELIRKNQCIVGYVGSHGLANNLEIVVRVSKLLVHRTDVTFVLVGNGPTKNRLMTYAKDLHNIIFLPPVPKRSIPSLLDKMDMLYIGLPKQPLFKFGVSPNKLLDYMMSGKPVISAINAGNDLVNESRCGFSIPPNDLISLKECIERMVALQKIDREAMGQRGRMYAIEYHSYNKLGKKFLHIMQEVHGHE